MTWLTDQEVMRQIVANKAHSPEDEMGLLDELGLLETSEEHCSDDSCEHIYSPPEK